MTDIVVPIAPADVIDLMILLQREARVSPDLARRAASAHRLEKVRRIAQHSLPPQADPFRSALSAARRDLIQLELDLRNSEARADLGVGFIALSRAYLDALAVWQQARSAYDAEVSLHMPPDGR